MSVRRIFAADGRTLSLACAPLVPMDPNEQRILDELRARREAAEAAARDEAATAAQLLLAPQADPR